MVIDNCETCMLKVGDDCGVANCCSDYSYLKAKSLRESDRFDPVVLNLNPDQISYLERSGTPLGTCAILGADSRVSHFPCLDGILADCKHRIPADPNGIVPEYLKQLIYYRIGTLFGKLT